MKVSLNWLRELVELPPTVPALVDLLTLAGVEVEDVLTTGCDIPNVIVAQIDEFGPHPNADRLSVCKVNDGTSPQRQIVCGAKNFKAGDKVFLALPGASLPNGVKIKAGKIRDVESNGMLCSAAELKLAEDADGLLILPPDSRIGTPIGQFYPGDTVLDLEITPNRSDLLSYVGIAMEIATLAGTKTSRPGGDTGWINWKKEELPTRATDSADGKIAVSIETKSPCYYSATLIRGTKVGPSPDWLRAKLEATGLRAINNAVDITNYMLLLIGAPTHVFDAAKVHGSIRVRDARDGETIETLDGKTYTLTPDDLVIADDVKALAIAGVMGGLASSVTNETQDIILEAATFEAPRIRRTSRRLGLVSDSSYRFERGVRVSQAVYAADVAAPIIAKLTGARGFYEKATADNGASSEFELRTAYFQTLVPLRPSRVAHLLGTEIPEDRIDQILTSFHLSKTPEGWRIPTARPDLTREVDLIEEIARVVGMDAIPARTAARFAPASATDRNYDRAMTFRRAFAAQGLHEARSLTLVPGEPLALAATKLAAKDLLRVKNPMLEEQVVLRPNLLHGLLTAVRENFRAGAKSVRLFELGRVFNVQRPEEFSHAAVVLAGDLGDRHWRSGESRPADLFDLKSILTAVFGPKVVFEPQENSACALSLIIKLHDKPVGQAGQLWPADARALDATVPVVFASIDLTALAKAAPDTAKKYREIPRYPAVTRDIALLAPLTLAHAQVEQTLLAAKEPLLAEVTLFDVFTDATGAKIPADKKSLAYSLTYRSAERTLTTEEVNAAHAKLKARLQPLGISLRE